MPTLADVRTRAQQLDAQDALAPFRQQFHIPRRPDGRPVVYLCGNSLGLQPKGAQAEVNALMQDWATLAVQAYGHAPQPWMTYADALKPQLAALVGAQPTEVALLNTLTVNLHLMMVSFYQPQGTRTKIVIEHRAFPSDSYAVQSHLRTRGYDPTQHLLHLTPAQGDRITQDDVARLIAEQGDEIALWLLGGVNYYTGQLLDIPHITRMAQESGARVGWDLAHAVGNVPLQLHDWGVDFAAWCHYKYMNGGPTCPGAIFVHSKHLDAAQALPRYEGWWGNHPDTRFLMRPNFDPAPGADAWVHSIPALLHLGCLKASLALFEQATLPALHAKSQRLTAFLAESLAALGSARIQVITPQAASERGAQLSLRVQGADRSLFDRLTAQHVVADWREPDTIRIAPIPLYNSFADVADFVHTLKAVL